MSWEQNKAKLLSPGIFPPQQATENSWNTRHSESCTYLQDKAKARIWVDHNHNASTVPTTLCSLLCNWAWWSGSTVAVVWGEIPLSVLKEWETGGREIRKPNCKIHQNENSHRVFCLFRIAVGDNDMRHVYRKVSTFLRVVWQVFPSPRIPEHWRRLGQMRRAKNNNCMAHFPPSRRPDYKTPADSLFLALTHTSSILNSGQITENEISFCCWCQINDIMYTVCAMLCLFLSPLSLSSSLLFTLPPHVFFSTCPHKCWTFPQCSVQHF